MDMSKAFPSTYLKAADVDPPIKGRIDGVTIEPVGQNKDMRPVLTVIANGEECQIVLNKTNNTTLIECYGAESDDWRGKPVIAFKARTMFQGQEVDCIRVKGQKPKPKPEPEVGRELEPDWDENEPDDDIPF